MDLSTTMFIILAFLVLNLAAFLLFGYDKVKAIKRSWRMPESTLLLLAMLGPFGAYLGMRIFHHKTRKLKFLLVPIFMVLHLAILAYVIVW